MVKFISTVFLIVSIAVSILASPIEQRDVTQVEHDLQETRNIVSRLDVEVTKIGNKIDFPQTMFINKDVGELRNLIDKSTRDVKGVHGVSEQEGKEILTQVQKFKPTILHLLQSIYLKKPVFFSSKLIVPIVKSQLNDLRTASSGLGDALIQVAPKSVKSEALHLKKDIDTAFDRVIAYYNK